jgi:hypothetical protein
VLTLRFRTPKKTYEVGPSEWIELRGMEIHVSSEDAPLAHFVSGRWIHRTLPSLSVECRGLLSFELRDPEWGSSPIPGPFFGMQLRDLHLFGGRMRIAKLSPGTGRWSASASDKSWSSIRVFARGPK